MIFRLMPVMVAVSVAAFSQMAQLPLPMDQMTPQQRMLAGQFFSQPELQQSSPSNLSLVKPVTQLETTSLSLPTPNNDLPEKSQNEDKTINSGRSGDLNLSMIEAMFRLVDTRHGVDIVPDSLEESPPVLRQFGYDFFNQSSHTVGNTVVPASYQIQPGDYLTIFVFGKKEQVLDVQLDNQGSVFLPNFGPVVLGGLTLSEAEKKIHEVFKKRYVNFKTKVKLNYVKPVMVLISGHVNRPGSYTVHKFESFFSLLGKANGIKKTGSLRHITILSTNGKKRSVDLYDYIMSHQHPPMIYFNEGDVIMVPAIGPTVAIGGAVNMPGIYELKKNTTLGHVLKYGGGLAMNAYGQSVYINEFDESFQRKVKSIEAKGNLLSVLNRMPAKNGDVVMIGQKPAQTRGVVNILGNVHVPGKFAFKPGMTLGELIAKGKGLKKDTHETLHVFRYVSEHQRDLVSTPIQNKAFTLRDRDVVTVYNKSKLKEPQLITVIGEVLAPGEYTFFDGMTLSDSLILAKPNAMASLKVLEVARSAGKESALFYVENLDLATFKLQSGDRISVKKDNLKDQMATIELTGEVAFPGKYKVAKGTRLAEVLERAGGFTDSAYLKGAVFTRASVNQDDVRGQKKVIDDEQRRFIYDQSHLGNLSMDSQVSMGIMMTARQEALQYLEKKVGSSSGRVIIDLHRSDFQGSSDNFVVQDGDKLSIPTKPESVHLIGGVQQGISIAYNPNYSLRDYIQNVGGFTKYADKGNIYIFKSSGRVFQRNTNIEPGDIVYVPERVVISFNWLQFLTNITSIVSNAVTSIALVKSLQ